MSNPQKGPGIIEQLKQASSTTEVDALERRFGSYEQASTNTRSKFYKIMEKKYIKYGFPDNEFWQGHD